LGVAVFGQRFGDSVWLFSISVYNFAIFLDSRDLKKVNVTELTNELMRAVPHTKIWVTELSDTFETVGL
jgi:hypothetical protein